MRRALLIVSALVASPLLVVGCGSGDEEAEPVATTHVSMARSYVFEPSAIVVDAGANVTFTNDDNFTHTVQVDGQADHRVDRGDAISIRFDRPGTYHYVCTLHEKDMSGKVVVR